MKPIYFIILAILLGSLACGPTPAAKTFFNDVCKTNSKTQTIKPQVEREKEESKDEPEASPTPEPSPTPPDYDNRCSEKDKEQFLADERAKELRRWAKREEDEPKGPSAAELEVSKERATKDCFETMECSGLHGFEVIIPPGGKYYGCFIRNGENIIQVYCQPEKKKD